MDDQRTALKRVLAPLEGPLRFARKNDQTLLALRGFDALAERAVAEARKFPLDSQQTRALDRLAQFAHAFDAAGLEHRKRAMDGIAAELGLLLGEPAGN